ncbi:MAG: hypothetical protein H0X64_07410 [Gemmatimonadaceae bacterium]|nr:hypothetical protein [Gemmatimonadaceae bacterium]
MHTAVRCLAVVALAGITACTRTNVALLDQSVTLSPTCEQGVILYTSPDKAPQHREIAILNSAGSSGFTTEAGMMKSMREKAASVGATGVILNTIEDASAGVKVAAAVFGVGTERKGRSVAIFAEADVERVRTTCASAAAQK